MINQAAKEILDGHREISYVRKRLSESQRTDFPKYTCCLSLDLEIHREVFWDEDNNATGRWVTENLPAMAGKEVLEIGCGCGLTALYLAKNGARHVLATDINPSAVTNTQANAVRNEIDNVTVVQSNLFEKINPSLRFNCVVCHMPATRVPLDFEFKSMVEHSSFDPGASLLTGFLNEAPKYLSPSGALLLCYNVSRDESFILEESKKFPVMTRKIASKKFTTDSMINVHLYEIRPLVDEIKT
nr:class I SAM-dependent methyltransferase [Sinorhizobium terangae]